MGATRGPIQCCPYGIGIVGNGATPQTSVAHGNWVRLQVGMRVSLPWVDAVTPGAVVMH